MTSAAYIEPEPGDSVWAITAEGKRVPRRAVSGVEGGDEHDFPVVWITWPGRKNWRTTRDVWPWPMEDVIVRA